MSASPETSDSIQKLEKLSELSLGIYNLGDTFRGALIVHVCRSNFPKATTKEEKTQIVEATILLQNAKIPADPAQKMLPTSSYREEPTEYHPDYINFLKETGRLANIIISFQPRYQTMLNDLLNYLMSQVSSDISSPDVRQRNEKLLSAIKLATEFLV